MLSLIIAMCLIFPHSVAYAYYLGKEAGRRDGLLEALTQHISTEYIKNHGDGK